MSLKRSYFFRWIWMSPCQVTVERTAHLRSPSGLCHWLAGTCYMKSWQDVWGLSRLTWRNQSALTPFMLWTLFFVTCPQWSKFYPLAIYCVSFKYEWVERWYGQHFFLSFFFSSYWWVGVILTLASLFHLTQLTIYIPICIFFFSKISTFILHHSKSSVDVF